MLKYAHENGCPWDRSTCYWAASGGHMAVLKYARQNRCPWSKRQCLISANGEEIRAWIMDQPDDPE